MRTQSQRRNDGPSYAHYYGGAPNVSALTWTE